MEETQSLNRISSGISSKLPVSSGIVQHVGTVQAWPGLFNPAPSASISPFFAMLLYGQHRLCFFPEELSALCSKAVQDREAAVSGKS